MREVIIKAISYKCVVCNFRKLLVNSILYGDIVNGHRFMQFTLNGTVSDQCTHKESQQFNPENLFYKNNHRIYIDIKIV